MAGHGNWVLSQIEIRPFLSVGPGGITVDLDHPVIVLQGPSGSGKATITSAIEWALFGIIETVPDYSRDTSLTLVRSRSHSWRGYGTARARFL